MREIFRLAHPLLLPERLAELAYKVIMSGFWLGSQKANRRRGDSEFCHHCHATETVEHAFFSCPKAKHVWQTLFEWWRLRTSESLDCSVRVALLGLRYSPNDDQDRPIYQELATPFVFLRTLTYETLHQERVRVRNGSPERSSGDLVTAIFKSMQRCACALLTAARSWDLWHPPKPNEVHPRSVEAFCEAWIHSGLAILTPSHDYPVVLRVRHQ